MIFIFLKKHKQLIDDEHKQYYWESWIPNFLDRNDCAPLIYLTDPLHNCTDKTNLLFLLFHVFSWADYGPTQTLVFHSLSYIGLDVLFPFSDHKNNSYSCQSCKHTCLAVKGY